MLVIFGASVVLSYGIWWACNDGTNGEWEGIMKV